MSCFVPDFPIQNPPSAIENFKNAYNCALLRSKSRAGALGQKINPGGSERPQNARTGRLKICLPSVICKIYLHYHLLHRVFM
jgi:hypothetical protein